MWLFLFLVSATADPALADPWLKLLRYKPHTISAGFESQIDAPQFFLSPNGKSDPRAEWIVTLNALKTDPKIKCRFPARHLLVNGKSTQSIRELDSCSEFQNFRDILKAKSVSLIFSSYFLNNPSSAFGHVFLRFNQSSSEGGPELLDHAIDFAANVDTQNALIYGIKGIFGMFKGTFSLKPYFFQVRQYAAFESRDLWSYRLRLSQDQVDYLIAHLWEVGQGWIDYYYFDENCAYHILGAIEATRPDLALTEALPPYVIPIDVVRILKTNNLLDEPSYRPSVKTSLDHRLSVLNSDQLIQVRLWTDLNESGPTAAVAEDASTLDAALDSMDYLYPYEVQLPHSDASKRKSLLGRLRAETKVASQPLALRPDPLTQPHLAHKTSLISVGSGFSQTDRAFTDIRFRPVFHDFLDPSAGLPQYAEIKFFDASVRWLINEQKIFLKDLTIFEVLSLTPWESVYKPLSWHLRVGAQTNDERTCRHCLSLSTEGGAGLSSKTTSLLVEAESTLNSKLQDDRIGYLALGPTILLRLQDAQKWGVVLRARYRYRFFLNRNEHFTEAESAMRYQMSENLSIVGTIGANDFQPQGKLEVRYYF